MNDIIQITGKVKFSITLDPSVWIFDDRKEELSVYFNNKSKTEKKNEEEEYIKVQSKYWEREIAEGSVSPPTLKTEKKYEKEKLLTGTFCIPLKPFLENAEPSEEAKHLIIETSEGEVKVPLEEGKEMVLGFSKDGKPLKEDGPVHCYFGDGSNLNNPIKRVQAFIID